MFSRLRTGFSRLVTPVRTHLRVTPLRRFFAFSTGAGLLAAGVSASVPPAVASTVSGAAGDSKEGKTAHENVDILTKTLHYYSGPLSEVDRQNLALFGGRANKQLVEDIARYLNVPVGKVKLSSFADGEIGIQVQENVRGRDVFILQPIAKPVNDNLIELLLMVSTMRRASAASITAVIPYFSYARQDRKFTSRVPISAADLALMLSTLGLDRVVAVDLHSGQIQGFFPPKVPVTHLNASYVGASYISERELTKPVIVAPDTSSVGRAKHFRDLIAKQGHQDAQVDVALIMSNRPKDVGGHIASGEQAVKMQLVGSVKDSDAIIVSDIIDTATTATKAAELLKVQGARKVIVFGSHGLFTEGAVQRIEKSPIDEVIVTNTVPLSEEAKSCNKIKQISLAPLLAEAIKRVYKNESISSLFKPLEASASPSSQQVAELSESE